MRSVTVHFKSVDILRGIGTDRNELTLIRKKQLFMIVAQKKTRFGPNRTCGRVGARNFGVEGEMKMRMRTA